MLRDLSIRHRLALGFGLVVTLMGIVALVAGVLFSRIENRRRAINDELVPQVAAANTLALAVNEQSTALRGYVTVGRRRFLSEFRDGVAGERSAVDKLKSEITESSEIAQVQEIESLLVQLHQDENEVLKLLSSRGKDAAFAYHQDHVRHSVQGIMSMSEHLASRGLDRIDTETQNTTAAMNRLYVISLGALAVALALALLTVLAAGRSVTRPARRIASVAGAIAEGDYSSALKLEKKYGDAGNYRDELSRIAVAIVRMARTIEAREQGLRELADKLQTANERLETQNEELQCQNEELQTQREEIQTQNEEIQSQNEELASQGVEMMEHNRKLEAITKDLMIRQSVTAVALSSLDRDEVLSRLLEAIMDPLEFSAGLIMLYDGDRKVLEAAIGRNVEIGSPPHRLKIGEGLAGRVAKSKKITFLPDGEALMPPDPFDLGISVQAVAGVPFTAGHLLYGVAVLGSSKKREFTEREAGLLHAFAERAVMAIQRAQAFEMVAAAEKRERFARERLQKIIDNMPEGVVIAARPDGQMVMANKAALALYGLESLPNVTIQERAEIFNMGRPGGQRIPSDQLPLSRSLFNGEICVGEEVVLRWSSGREMVLLCNTVPLTDAEGNITEAIGVLQDITAIKEQQHSLEKVYQSQRTITETLQKSFLPSKRPIIPGYEIAEAYEPAQQDPRVGGDFYDLIELSDGLLGIVMGDVSGKGVSAAIHTAMAKYMLRGFAHEDHSPDRVLVRLNNAITRYVRGEIFITIFYGILDTAKKKLVYANGGHEQPILYRRRSGECICLLSSGPAIGVIPGSAYQQFEVDLADGDAFVLYTDGITEARRKNEFLGQDGLSKMIADMGSKSASHIAKQILANVREYSEDGLHDDIALLVVKTANGRS